VCDAKATTQLHAQIAPATEHWISTGAGMSSLGDNYLIHMDDAQVELYIDLFRLRIADSRVDSLICPLYDCREGSPGLLRPGRL